MIHLDDIAADLHQQLSAVGITNVSLLVARSTWGNRPAWHIAVHLDDVNPGDEPDTERLNEVRRFFCVQHETIRTFQYPYFVAVHLTRDE